jgi:hypothetical protein
VDFAEYNSAKLMKGKSKKAKGKSEGIVGFLTVASKFYLPISFLPFYFCLFTFYR